MEDGMTTSILSRRTLVASAAAVPALAVSAAAVAGPTPAGPTTLPPELIERFVRVRAWYLDNHKRYLAWSDEVDRRLYAATGVSREQYLDMDYKQRRANGLGDVHSRLCNEVPHEESEGECEQLGDERWAVAEAIMNHQPQTFADLAWQAEAFLVADLEILHEQPNECASDRLIRTLFQHIRTLGALPQPDDPLRALSIDIYSDSDAEA
jgi:hypothetical protein